MKIHEALTRDPRLFRLANDGQARIGQSHDDRTHAELRAELETFVCDGRFSDALQRILEAYLTNLDAARQESVWISGFFGSGKSHLLKMLAHLWRNTEFEDGATARSLVPGGLPSEINAQLSELDTQARRTQRPVVAAAETLLGGSTDHVRHTVLSILLRACGWHSRYPQAMFCFWLREQGFLAAVRDAVEATGRDWLRELNNLYVSPLIARALIEADPNFADDERQAREFLSQQFPKLDSDLTTEQFIEAAHKALSFDDDLPLTILVLDEVQQYINQAQDRAAIIVEVAEAIQTRFQSRVTLVAAGQSALSASTPALMWLRDRFRIAVELTDADVEAVTRKVLLQKKPSAEAAVKEMFERHSGEIDRHLHGTSIGVRREDRRVRVIDYPLLSTRRRFWEACFRAVEPEGTQSQLRSQLRILHDSLHKVAEQGLGTVIPASDLFDALAPSLVNTGVMLNEINTRIQKLDDGSDQGRLRRDLCGLAFLIGKLPREVSVDVGVRANISVLADLLAYDVSVDSGPYRKRVAEALDELVGEGILMQVGEEYRLQTTEGAEWDRAFRERRTALGQKEVDVATRRNQLFGQTIQEVLSGIRPVHGASKLRRTLALHTGDELPAPDSDAVTLWLRDGWSCSEGEFETQARQQGAEDPVVHVHLPRRNSDALRDRIIEVEAANQVLARYGAPASPEGREAQESMKSRLGAAKSARDGIVREVIHAAKVLQGGGSEVFGQDITAKIDVGAQKALARLFPHFSDGDHRAWEAAVKRAKGGSDQPFKVVDWENATEDHPVAREVLDRADKGVRGTDLRKTLKAAPYGWPQDAIDAALIALHQSGHLCATRNGRPVATGSLDQAGIKSTEFRPERVRLTATQRIALRGLFQKLDVTSRSGEEGAHAPDFLQALVGLAARVGGEPPLPLEPDVKYIDDLGKLTGNEQLAAILENKDELEQSISTWKTLARCKEARFPAWKRAVALRRHAEADNLSVLGEVGPELDAITAQRSLLDETDHLAPLVAKLAASLRQETTVKHDQLAAAIERADGKLTDDAIWTKLAPTVQADIRRELRIEAPSSLSVATDEDLLRTLDARPINAWQAEVDAVGERIIRALEEAACRLKEIDPSHIATTITIHRGTLSDEMAVRKWLEEQENALLEAIKKGPVIIR